jgi:hypothetical protein
MACQQRVRNVKVKRGGDSSSPRRRRGRLEPLLLLLDRRVAPSSTVASGAPTEASASAGTLVGASRLPALHLELLRPALELLLGLGLFVL